MLTTVLSPSETHQIKLHIATPLEEWGGKWLRLEVWRSVLGEGGPYEPLFSSVEKPARVPVFGGERDVADGATVDLTGKPLKLKIGGLSYEFNQTGAATLKNIAIQIELALPLKAWVDDTRRLVLETVQVGDTALLEVLPSDAAALLGLPTSAPWNVGAGLGVPLALLPNVSEVVFLDRFGQDSYVYKSRYTDGVTASEWSAPVSGFMSRPAVSSTALAVGWLRIMDSSGQPRAGQRVVAHPVPAPRSPAAGWVEMSTPLEEWTDKTGRVEFSLIRGGAYDVSVPGTGIIRRVKIPVVGEGPFYLLGDTLAQDDGMSIQRLDTIYADRRST